jgi:hypothetical protein
MSMFPTEGYYENVVIGTWIYYGLGKIGFPLDSMAIFEKF